MRFSQLQILISSTARSQGTTLPKVKGDDVGEAQQCIRQPPRDRRG
jgi:hypothetical protein